MLNIVKAADCELTGGVKLKVRKVIRFILQITEPIQPQTGAAAEYLI